jgi:integrase
MWSELGAFCISCGTERPQMAQRTRIWLCVIVWPKSCVAKIWPALGETVRLGFPVRIHMLRHSAGYALAGRGVDTRTLQAFMGHRSISNTVIYTAVADKRVRNIWQKS